MKTIFMPILMLCLCVTQLLASGGQSATSARFAGMGGVSVVFPDFQSVWHNPAGIYTVKSPTISAVHAANFLISQMGSSGLAFALPSFSGTLAASYSNYGYKNYLEQKAGLLYGRCFGKKFSAGLQLNYHNTRLPEAYGNGNAVSVDAGMQLIPIDNFFMGFNLTNITRSNVSGDLSEPLPTLFSLGAGYVYQNAAVFCAQVDKNIDSKPLLRLGLEYNFSSKFFIRSGFCNENNTYSFGLGYTIRRIQADLAFRHHATLGFTPQFALSYAFK
jgi:hypothetical protein